MSIRNTEVIDLHGGAEEIHEIFESESECRNLNHVPSEIEAIRDVSIRCFG